MASAGVPAWAGTIRCSNAAIVRSGAGLDTAVVCELPPGTSVAIVGEVCAGLRGSRGAGGRSRSSFSGCRLRSEIERRRSSAEVCAVRHSDPPWEVSATLEAPAAWRQPALPS